MKEYFNKLCIYYLNHFNKSYYKKTIKEAKKKNIDTKKIDSDAKEYVNILKEKLKEFNYKGTKSETYEMINKYIKIKDDMDEEDKKIYLEILRSLCMIYGIDLRNELIDYITEIPKEEDIFNELCKYYLEGSSEDEFNSIKDRGKLINFEELDDKASSLIKEIKKILKKYNISIVDKLSLYEEIQRYISIKDKYSDEEKSEVLKVLAISSRLYGVNLKEEIEDRYKKIDREKNFIKSVNNPLDNKLFLMSYLYQRYNDRLFDVYNLKIPNYYKDNNSDEDYSSIQAKLITKIISIYLDKINNYGVLDINPIYTSILSVDDMTRIDELNEDDVVLFIDYINKRVEEEIICRKLNISDTLYHFLVYLFGISDIFSDNIGRFDKNLFNINNEKEEIAIYVGCNKNIDSYNFLSKYIIKCIENNISYNMKNNFSNRERTILYANKEDFYIKLSILEEIANENKDIIDSFDNIIISVGSIDNKYYGVSVSHIEDIEYNSIFDRIAEISYYRVLAKLEINKDINEDDKKVLEEFIELNNINIDIIKDMNLFIDIKNLVNKYIVEVSDSLDIYMSSEKNIEIVLNEFRKSMLYIFNIIRGYNKKSINNICISLKDIS